MLPLCQGCTSGCDGSAVTLTLQEASESAGVFILKPCGPAGFYRLASDPQPAGLRCLRSSVPPVSTCLLLLTQVLLPTNISF